MQINFKTKQHEEIYRCPDCNYELTIWRNAGQKREKNHKKWAFCVGCAKKKNLIKVNI